MAEELLSEIPGRENISNFLFGGTKEVSNNKAVVFENEINTILRAIQAFSSGKARGSTINIPTGSLLTTKDKVDLKVNFDMGTGKITWDGNSQINNISNFVEFSAIKQIYQNYANLTKIYEKDQPARYSNGIFNMVGRQIKADIVNTKEWNFEVLADYGFSNDFLKDVALLQQCSFSLKSYDNMKTVKLGHSNIIRLLLLILPTFNSIAILNPEQYISFLMALFTRYYNPKSQSMFFRNPWSPQANISLIGLHFFHIQIIYELMGIGQQGHKNEDIMDDRLAEINQLLIKGVNYLIVNDHTSENIKVLSTKKILYDTFQYYFQNNGQLNGSVRIPDYRRGTQSIITRKFDFNKNIIT